MRIERGYFVATILKTLFHNSNEREKANEEKKRLAYLILFNKKRRNGCVTVKMVKFVLKVVIKLKDLRLRRAPCISSYKQMSLKI